MKSICCILVLILMSHGLNAQWSNTSSSNLSVCDLAGAQYVPHIIQLEDGSSYISWYSMNEGNLNMRLQYLSVNGEAQWAQNGIIVSAHTQNSWVADYDLDVDNEGNAVIAFSDVRNGMASPNVYKISQTGEFLWGADGISLSTVGEEFFPRLTVCSDNGVIICWSRPAEPFDQIIMSKILTDGNWGWGADGIILQTGDFDYAAPEIIAIDDNNSILCFSKQSGPFWSPNRHLFAQKFDSDGAPLWIDDVIISDQGGISGWTEINIIADGNNGVIIGWHDDRDNDQLSNPWIQHIGEDGSPLAINGVQLTSEPNKNHFYVMPIGISDSGEIYACWMDTDANQNLRGMRSQKISSQADLLWGNNGIEVVGLSAQFSGVNGGVFADNKCILFYESYDFSNILETKLYAIALNTDGIPAWLNSTVEVSISESQRIHLEVSNASINQVILCWEDMPVSGGTYIKAQNLYTDGHLGIPTTIQENENIDLLIYPNPAKDFVSIKSNEKIIQLIIIDLQGNKVLEISGEKNEHLININNLAAGLYNIIVLTENNKVNMKKILIQ